MWGLTKRPKFTTSHTGAIDRRTGPIHLSSSAVPRKYSGTTSYQPCSRLDTSRWCDNLVSHPEIGALTLLQLGQQGEDPTMLPLSSLSTRPDGTLCWNTQVTTHRLSRWQSRLKKPILSLSVSRNITRELNNYTIPTSDKNNPYSSLTFLSILNNKRPYICGGRLLHDQTESIVEQRGSMRPRGRTIQSPK